MHENLGNSVIFYAHYTEGGVNKTGLTVTIDVYEVIRDGTATLVVDDGACTEIGAGLYRYLLASGSVDAAGEYVGVFHTATDTVDAQDIPAIWVINRAGTETLDSGVSLADDAITSAKFDESTAFPVKSADTGATQIARVGADSDTLETLSDQMDTITTWTSTAISASYTAGAITQIRGNSWDIDMTGMILDPNKQQFVIKRKPQDLDADAILFVDSATGLITLNGVSTGLTAGDAVLTYAGTTLNLTITKASITAQLPNGVNHYGAQGVSAAGLVSEPYGGTFTITNDIVRATT